MEKLPFEKTNAFSHFFQEFVNQKETLKPFYHRFPTIENFAAQIEEKEKSFSEANRLVLTNALTIQYEGFTLSNEVSSNVQALSSAKTFTITTGHQLNIFTGPLYFIYKIVTVINACKELSKHYPAYKFVPVYWMASEDHDYDEIKSFRLFGEKYVWQTQQQGAVGRFHTKDFEILLDQIPGNIEIFKQAYLKHHSLSKAVRYYVNELFKSEGLVIVDGDDQALKKLLIPVIQDDVLNNTTKKLVDQTNSSLESLGHKPQIFCRDINFFYLDNNIRSRIEKRGDSFEVLDSTIKFTESELTALIKSNPEKFSPNVILRPLYQEIILPNLAYSGGPAEIVYWLQLKDVFHHFNTPFPILLPRCFGMLIDKPLARKIEKTGLSLEEIFLEKNYLFNHFVLKNANEKIVLHNQKKQIEDIFTRIKIQAEQVDTTLGPLLGAETRRMQKSLERIEQKLLKAEKRKQSDSIRQIDEIKQALFPNGSLQERTDNFLNFYNQHPDFIQQLLRNFNPFDLRFNVLYL